MSKLSEWLKKKTGAPEVNVAQTPLAALVNQKLTAPVAQQIAAALPDAELNTLYTATIGEVLKRQRAQGGANNASG